MKAKKLSNTGPTKGEREREREREREVWWCSGAQESKYTWNLINGKRCINAAPSPFSSSYMLYQQRNRGHLDKTMMQITSLDQRP